MPCAATLRKAPAHRYDPLGPLADAIGSMTGTFSCRGDGRRWMALADHHPGRVSVFLLCSNLI